MLGTAIKTGEVLQGLRRARADAALLKPLLL